MIYKVEIIKKDNLSQIRYIGNNVSKIGKLIELDEFRDLANFIMTNDPRVTYDQAFKMAKDLKVPKEEFAKEETSLEKGKVKVLTLEQNAS